MHKMSTSQLGYANIQRGVVPISIYIQGITCTQKNAIYHDYPISYEVTQKDMGKVGL